MTDTPEITAAKRAMRLAARTRRAHDAETAQRLRDALFATLLKHPGLNIGSVWPLPGEVDLRPLNTALTHHGRFVLLPETLPKGEPLLFRHWTPESSMLPGRYGTSHPDGASGQPDILLVPALAFTRTGYRLGYGGGYYDRTIAALPGVTTIGFALSDQEVDALPIGTFDQPLDLVVTERDVIQCTG